MKTPCSFPRTGLLLAQFCLVSLLSFNSYAQWAPSTVDGTYLSNASGIVGIGTSGVPVETRPTYNNAKLVIKGGVTGTATTVPDWCLKLQHATPDAKDWLIGSSGNGWAIGPGKFVISNSLTASVDASLVIDNNRNVGIGQVNPTHKLDVNGDVNATQILAGIPSTTSPSAYSGYMLAVGGKAVMEEAVIKLKANWPDYVFENTYKLPSLLEVGRYIRENKHLPDVPTAQEVKENGLSLGEMNAVLLKKIEELTLYVLDLKKESIESQKKASELQKEIEALKARQ
jgi:hypothetical protein